MSTSKIYNSSDYLYGIGKRKGKRKHQIERDWKYYRFAGERKSIRANDKVIKHIDELKKLTNRERLERINNK